MRFFPTTDVFTPSLPTYTHYPPHTHTHICEIPHWRDADGPSEQGQFRDGFPDGDGVVRWSDGSWYEGQFRRGVRHGRGLYVSAEDGRRRHGGLWARGERHGPGETACAAAVDGATDYAGDWADGRPHGRGTATWPDGTQYDGHWARGLRHGRGRAVWPDGDVSNDCRDTAQTDGPREALCFCRQFGFSPIRVPPLPLSWALFELKFYLDFKIRMTFYSNKSLFEWSFHNYSNDLSTTWLFE